MLPTGTLRKRHGIPRLDGNIAAAAQLGACLHALRREDIAAFAVGVEQQGDMRRAVRIVFDALHPRRHAGLVPLEIDHAVKLLVAAALVPGGDAPAIVPSTVLGLGADQGGMRATLVQVGRYHLDDETASG